jgi:hypothetical protein
MESAPKRPNKISLSELRGFNKLSVRKQGSEAEHAFRNATRPMADVNHQHLTFQDLRSPSVTKPGLYRINRISTKPQKRAIAEFK